MDTQHRPPPTARPRPPEAAAHAARTPRLRRPPHPAILAPTLLSFRSSSVRLNPQLADAPPGPVPFAFQAGATTGIDPNVLLAIGRSPATGLIYCSDPHT